MKIGIISDSHDHHEHVLKAIEIFNEKKVDYILHAGDIVSPFTARAFGQVKGAKFIMVFGNCDGEHRGLADILKESIAKPPITFELAGRRFVLAHDESQISEALLSQAQVAVVGHSHSPSQTHNGHTLVVNPGECCGRVTGQATVALLDSQDLSVEVITLT